MADKVKILYSQSAVSTINNNYTSFIKTSDIDYLTNVSFFHAFYNCLNLKLTDEKQHLFILKLIELYDPLLFNPEYNFKLDLNTSVFANILGVNIKMHVVKEVDEKFDGEFIDDKAEVDIFEFEKFGSNNGPVFNIVYHKDNYYAQENQPEYILADVLREFLINIADLTLLPLPEELKEATTSVKPGVFASMYNSITKLFL